MKKVLLIIAQLSLSFLTFAQFNASFEGNGQWYIDDSKIKLTDADTTKRIRSNAYLKLDYSIKNWDFSTQLESYSPLALLNFSPDLKGVNVGSLYARYRNSDWGLDVTAGHLYEQFGNGLILRSYEDRQLGINNAILGGRIIYAPIDGLKVTALSGKQRIGMGFDLSDGTIFAGNIEASISEFASFENFGLDLGLSYVGRYEDIQELFPNTSKLVGSYSARLNFTQGNFYVGGEYVYKEKDALIEMGQIQQDYQNPGNALFFNIGYSKKGFGLDINLRRTENMNFFSQRDLAGNIYNIGTINYIPALTKQYDHSLQNIYIYQAQPNLQFMPLFKVGEIGGQLDLFYEFKKGTVLGGKYGTNIALNASYWSGIKATETIQNRTYSGDYFAFGEKYYHDIGFEVRKRASKNLSLIFMYLNQFYNKRYVEESRGEVKTHVITAEGTYKFGNTQSVKLELQHHWADSEYKNWVGGTLEYNLNYNWSFFVNDIYNYGNDDESKRIHYYNAGLSFVYSSVRIALSYGRQRGGLMCVGGVCRMVSEAAGLTLGITASI